MLLDDSLQQILSISLSDSAVTYLYDSIVFGPAIGEVFLRELATVATAENRGGRASSSRKTAIKALSRRVECSIQELGLETTKTTLDNKQQVSRQDPSPIIAARVGIQCRMLACLLKAASHGVTSGSDEAKEALVLVENARNRIFVSDAGGDFLTFDDISRSTTSKRASSLRADLNGRRWTRDILLSGCLRVQVGAESLRSGHQEDSETAVEEKLLLCAGDIDAIAELRNQAVSLFVGFASHKLISLEA